MLKWKEVISKKQQKVNALQVKYKLYDSKEYDVCLKESIGFLSRQECYNEQSYHTDRMLTKILYNDVLSTETILWLKQQLN
jgi:hypothetical protein